MSGLTGGTALVVLGADDTAPTTPTLAHPTLHHPTLHHPQRHPQWAIGSLQLNGASTC